MRCCARKYLGVNESFLTTEASPNHLLVKYPKQSAETVQTIRKSSRRAWDSRRKINFTDYYPSHHSLHLKLRVPSGSDESARARDSTQISHTPLTASDMSNSVLRAKTPTFSHHGIAFSPFFEDRIALASGANFGLVGNGRLHVMQIGPGGLKVVKQ